MSIFSEHFIIYKCLSHCSEQFHHIQMFEPLFRAVSSYTNIWVSVQSIVIFVRWSTVFGDTIPSSITSEVAWQDGNLGRDLITILLKYKFNFFKIFGPNFIKVQISSGEGEHFYLPSIADNFRQRQQERRRNWPGIHYNTSLIYPKYLNYVSRSNPPPSPNHAVEEGVETIVGASKNPPRFNNDRNWNQINS